jgi:hypothetical protein
MALNFAYVPALIYSHFIGEASQKYGYLNQISQPNGEWKTILNASGVLAGERIYLADPTLFRDADWHGYRNFSQFSAINVASINSWPKIRDASTLTSGNHGGATKFLNVVDSSHGCKPVEIGFLSVSHVLVRNNECKAEYDIVFGEGGYIRKALQNPNNWKSEDQVWLYSIKNFSSVYLISEYKNGLGKCSMLSSLRCISKLGLSSSDHRLKSPIFKLCVSDCLANVVIPRLEVGTKIALPINFDETVQVKSDSTGAYLKTFSYHGLLGVFIDSGFNEDQRLLVSIKPDIRMILNALSAWVHLILLTALLVIACRLPRHSKKQ